MRLSQQVSRPAEGRDDGRGRFVEDGGGEEVRRKPTDKTGLVLSHRRQVEIRLLVTSGSGL